jgi:polyhydroxybutyrate depolymerase
MTNSIFIVFVFVSLFLFTHCDNNEPVVAKSYRFYKTMSVDGRARTYLLNLPPRYYDRDSSVFSLVIGLHGTGGKASQFELDYGLTEKAKDEGFIVVYPEGVQSNGVLGVRTWNAGKCCDYANDNNVNDVLFIRELIDKLVAAYRINSKRVYVTGMSNGGMMAYRLACEMPDKIAAIAAVSSTMIVAEPCHVSRPVPVLHMHAMLDTKVPYAGGVGIGGYYFPPVDSVLNAWSSENACAVAGEVVVDNADYRFTRWSACDGGVTIECYLTRDGGHAWPGGSRSSAWADTPSVAINANDLLWEFFERYELVE